MMETKREFIEFLTVSAACLALGTLVAIGNVRAQDKAVKPAAACATAKEPDAMCTVATLKKTDVSKVCFGAQHPRCFELKTNELTQSVRGVRVQKTMLDDKQLASIKSALANYDSWLETSHLAIKNSAASCLNPVAIDMQGKHGEFCLSAMPKKDAESKTSAVIAALERPMGLTTSAR